jgi:hypothetical protein
MSTLTPILYTDSLYGASRQRAATEWAMPPLIVRIGENPDSVAVNTENCAVA